MLRTRVLSAAVLIPLVAFATYAGGWVLAGVVLVAMLLAGHELVALMKKAGYRPSLIASGVVMAAFVGQHFGLSRLDGVAGLGVAAMILYAGWEIARHSVNELLGEKPSEEMIQNIKDMARTIPHVMGVHDLICHRYGQTTIISLHVVISEHHSLKAAHEIADQVAGKIDKTFHTHTTVHLDPINTRDPLRKKLDVFLREFLAGRPNKVSFHDLRTHGKPNAKRVYVDCAVALQCKDEDIRQFRQALDQAIRQAFPMVKKVHIEIEPKYVR